MIARCRRATSQGFNRFHNRRLTNDRVPPPAGEPDRSRVVVFETTRIMVGLRQLGYFLAAVEHGSFRKAASNLGVQESTISRRIRDLGASLFIRYNGGVRLTVAGQKYVRHARKALRQIGLSAKDVTAIGRSEVGRIRIGILSAMASGFLFELLRSFDRQHAAVQIEFVDAEPADHIAEFRKRDSTSPSSPASRSGPIARLSICGRSAFLSCFLPTMASRTRMS
jgi:hypothetical protein